MANKPNLAKRTEKQSRIDAASQAYVPAAAEIEQAETYLRQTREKAWPTIRALVTEGVTSVNLDHGGKGRPEDIVVHTFRADTSSPKLPHPTDPSKGGGYAGYNVTKAPLSAGVTIKANVE